jgi:hypothetical protein
MALNKLISNEVGITAAYHRIAETRIDFDLNQQTIVIKSYADESYRNREKEALVDIEAKIVRYAELSGEAELTEEETEELKALNIQELEARKVPDLSMRTMIVTVPINEDTRAELYMIIEATIPDFKGSTDI